MRRVLGILVAALLAVGVYATASAASGVKISNRPCTVKFTVYKPGTCSGTFYPSPSMTLQTTVSPSLNPGFVTRSGTSLMLNGSVYRFTGFNMPYAMPWHTFAPSNSTELDGWNPAQTVVRIFAFQTYNIVSGAINWTAMDAMLATIAAHGKKVILVLGNSWNGVGGSNDDGAEKFLAWWQGGGASGYDTFVQTASAPAQVVTYREYVRQIVTRYASNPTILMWQLVNEGDASTSAGVCSEASALTAQYNFATDVGGLVKSIDPNHLVSLGSVSGECGSNTTDYATLYANPQIDVADYHGYAYPTSSMDNTDAFNGLQTTLNNCATANKPLIFGESGIDWVNETPPYGGSPISPNTLSERAILLGNKVAAQFAAGIAGMLMWSWRSTPATPGDQGDYGYEFGVGDPALANFHP